ncbi:MAG: hypothetical protein AAFO73_02980 [Pseudomonadota bacterium]
MTQRFTRSLPASRPARIALGIALIVGGLLGFLPILGFWMLPLGFVVLSVDFPTIRRARRRVQVRVMRWWRQR